MDTEKCPYLFRIDSIDFIILALVSRNCPTYFSLLPLVPINFWPLMAYFIVFSLDFSSFFQSIVTMGCHHLFNLFHQFQHQFLLVSSFFGKDFKRSSLFKSALSGAGSDQLPSWDDFVTAICLQFYTVLFFQ